ncbi:MULTISPECIES: glycosyltransferase family 2 protein [unclassified Neisseria]|uniref:glycosyltransferase family 2 protein n=1 Tax=unclassified Neisseria TaxID=2623750 RepID=UPI001072D21A|nr:MULTISPECIES: glycosyltransferase family 2 protein [unclassified Neisseria]MBF0803242.1 glycosyltransferase family 2 protein [Neisseria sp. 19428wB4_WF04]TFU44081.1 glycosyltransferase family 2 protein [Neisseria sp. WF04]
MNQTVSVVIRTMPGREHFLDKCLFILSGQQHHDLEPIIVSQCKTRTDSLEKTRLLIEKWQKYYPNIRFLHHVSEADARSLSLNMGMEAATGRYLAFLDDDDKVYPHHYQQLVQALQKSKFAWAYSGIVRADFNKDGQLISRSYPFYQGEYSFHEHMKNNFIPIHSFVLDRERAGGLGTVNEQLCKNEDYEFLLRLAFRHEPLRVPGHSAEYCIRSDGSNTILSGGAVTSHEAMQKREAWHEADRQLYRLKVKHFGWWVKEIDTIAVNPIFNGSPANSLPASQHLVDIYRSHTWKIIRFGKKINWAMRGRPKKRNIIPPTAGAEAELFKIIFSPAWLLFSPLYCLEQSVRKLFRKQRVS